MMSKTRNIARSERAATWLGLSRAEMMTLVAIVGLANAMMPDILGSVKNDGGVYAVANTFGVSAIVWLGMFVATKYLIAADIREISFGDRAVAAAMLLCYVLPLGPGIWPAITLFAVYLICSSQSMDMYHRAGWVVLAITVPMFWSKRIFNFFSEYFLAIDAELVSSITGTERISNLVPMPSGSGFLQIAAPCSSMANISLAVLCWILFTQSVGVRWRLRNVFWCAIACASVIAINVTRISLIGFFPEKFDLLHGSVGATVASWSTVISVLSICYYGVGRGRLKIF